MTRHYPAIVRAIVRATLLACLALAVFTVTGCARPARVVVRNPHAKVVVVANNHHHSAHCGHYRKGNTWYLVKGHVHGARCGHVKVNHVWIVR